MLVIYDTMWDSTGQMARAVHDGASLRGVEAVSIGGMSIPPIRENPGFHTPDDTVEHIEPEAVETCLNIAYRYIVDARGQPRSVETGIRTGQEVQITAGLRPGDRVITSGIQRLQRGLPVRPAGEGADP